MATDQTLRPRRWRNQWLPTLTFLDTLWKTLQSWSLRRYGERIHSWEEEERPTGSTTSDLWHQRWWWTWRTSLLTQPQMPEELHLCTDLYKQLLFTGRYCHSIHTPSPRRTHAIGYSVGCFYYATMWLCCAFCGYNLLACTHFVLYLRKTRLGQNVVQN